jgi:PAP2 superfamily
MLPTVHRIAWVSRIRAFLAHRDGLKQIAVVIGAVAAYELARVWMHPDWAAAIANARRVTELEDVLSLGWEPQLQDAFMAVPELVRAMNVFYFVAHFLITGLFFFWLYHRSRGDFRIWRDGFLVATLIAVLIHWRFPTAPPRIAEQGTMVDTLRALSGIDIGRPGTSALTNPVAAVPSLHAGYAVGVGIGLYRFARTRAWRAMGLVYPALVILTIIVTGNHFVLDALAGIAVLAAGFLLAPPLRRAIGRRRNGAILASATRGGAAR